MSYFFVFITSDTETFVTFMLILMCDHGGARNTLTKITSALLIFTLRFLLIIIKALLAPKVYVAHPAGYSNSCGYTRGIDHSHYSLIAEVHHVIFTRLANVTFSDGCFQVSDDVTVLRHLVKQEIDTLVGPEVSL